MKTEDVWKHVTHIYCEMCDSMHEATGDTITSMDEIEDYYDLMECCSDPFLIGLIISTSPLFPEDDPESETNVDYFIEIFDHYRYSLDEGFFDKLDVLDG